MARVTSSLQPKYSTPVGPPQKCILILLFDDDRNEHFFIAVTFQNPYPLIETKFEQDILIIETLHKHFFVDFSFINCTFEDILAIKGR